MKAMNWRTIPIGELGRVVTGKTPPTKRCELFGEEYPFITLTDIGVRVKCAESAKGNDEETRAVKVIDWDSPGSNDFLLCWQFWFWHRPPVPPTSDAC